MPTDATGKCPECGGPMNPKYKRCYKCHMKNKEMWAAKNAAKQGQ